MTSYEPGSKIVLERNEEYVGEKPAIQKIVYSIYSDLKQTLLKLRAHELGVGELSAGQYREEILEPEKSGKKPTDSPFFDGRIQCQNDQASRLRVHRLERGASAVFGQARAARHDARVRSPAHHRQRLCGPRDGGRRVPLRRIRRTTTRRSNRCRSIPPLRKNSLPKRAGRTPTATACSTRSSTPETASARPSIFGSFSRRAEKSRRRVSRSSPTIS